MNKIIVLVGIIMVVMIQSVSAEEWVDPEWQGGSPAINMTPIIILFIAILAASVIVIAIYAWLHYKSMQLETEKGKTKK